MLLPPLYYFLMNRLSLLTFFIVDNESPSVSLYPNVRITEDFNPNSFSPNTSSTFDGTNPSIGVESTSSSADATNEKPNPIYVCF
mgnify:CR=1 FL=1